MFKRTRRRLMLFFTGMMMIFLAAFMTITYFWLSTLIMDDQKEEVQALAKAELSHHKSELLDWYGKERTEEEEEHEEEYEREEDEQEDNEREEEDHPSDDRSDDAINYDPDLRVFYYVITEDGNILDGDITLPSINEELIDRLRKWQPDGEKVRYESFTLSGDRNVKLLLSGEPVMVNGEYIGSIYTGTNVTKQQEVLRQLLLVLLPVSVIFLILSSILGYVISGKTMSPIIRAYNRQKEFVSDASHELRTPLSIMQSSVEMLEEEEKESLSDFSKQTLTELKEEVKRMSGLVSDLLTLARSDSNTVQLHFENMDLHQIIRRLDRRFRPFAESENINLELDIPNRIPIRADKERVTQLLTILLDNALKYNVANGSIKLVVKQASNHLEIQVKDTGIGIPTHLQKRIFDRFFRADKARSREMGSSGLGLAIAKWIVEEHNGTIKVESQEGKGSVFTVLLPSHQDGGVT